MLQGQADRVNYLMTKQAKIVAMTCTHAALKRREFLELGFKFDNLLMEESAQILEIETFIPMLLQVRLQAVSSSSAVGYSCTSCHSVAAIHEPSVEELMQYDCRFAPAAIIVQGMMPAGGLRIADDTCP